MSFLTPEQLSFTVPGIRLFALVDHWEQRTEEVRKMVDRAPTDEARMATELIVEAMELVIEETKDLMANCIPDRSIGSN